MSSINKWPAKIHNIQAYRAYFEKVKPEDVFKGIDFEWDLSIEDADNPDIREIFGVNVGMLDKFKKLYNKKVHQHIGYMNQSEESKKVYILTGVQITNEDFYWIMVEPGKPKKLVYLTGCADVIEAQEES